MLILQIPCGGGALEITKHMNDHMEQSGFQVKIESWHFAKNPDTSWYDI